MAKGPKIQTEGLLLYFKCPDCNKMQEWGPSSLHSEGTPICEEGNYSEGDDYCGANMEYYGFRVVNNRRV